ncbi:MAG: tetratricopeptide repeat protein [Myxococcota bacterium]
MGRDKDPLQKSDEHNARGIELADRGWLEEAVNEFKKAIALDPDSAHAHDNLATVFAEKGQYLEAMEEYLTALRLEPQSPTAHYNLACFLAAHSHEWAIREYKTAIELEYDYPDAHLNLGLTYAERGMFAEAMAEYEVALKLNPGDPVAHHELATVLMDLGRHSDAITHLRNVLRAEADNVDALVDLGICYTAKGFYQEAEKSLTRAETLAPEDALCQYHLAALNAVRGNRDRALTHLANAAVRERDRVRLWADADRLFDAMRADPRFQDILRPS